jgi:hypothetical protein
MESDDRLEQLRAEHHRLMHSMEYAFAMGSSRTLGGRHPRLEAVVERVDAIRDEIAALEAQRSTSG